MNALIEGPYLRDILGQPGALADTLAGLEATPALIALAQQVREGRFTKIVLTGMGSSFHALHPFELGLTDELPVPVRVETSELIHHRAALLGPRTLLVAVSQSGRSAEAVRLLELNAGRSPVVAVTNAADSPLAKGAQALILTRAGSEFSVSCKTYVTALLALRWLTLLLQGRLGEAVAELTPAASCAQAYLDDWQKHVASLGTALANTRHLYLMGRGASIASAFAGALFIKEATRLPAEGMSSAAFRHGPLELVGPEFFGVVFRGAEPTAQLNERLVADLLRLGSKAALVSEDSPSAEFRLPRAAEGLRPILEILPVQMITLALAAREGREAGRFDRATKVTTTE